jgi:hypothetical protein
LCGSQGLLIATGICRSSKILINGYFFFVYGTYVVFLIHLATSRRQPTTSGQLREERRPADDMVCKMNGILMMSL